MQKVEFTVPIRVPTGTAALPGDPALICEIEGHVEVSAGDGWPDRVIYVRDALTGEHRPLDPVRSRDWWRAIDEAIDADPDLHREIVEAEDRDLREQAAQDRLRERAPEVA